MLLDALDGDRAAATDWLWAGGKEALASWGLSPDLPRDQWEAALPPSHLTWLRSLALTHREGDYLFVHAGIRPGVPLADQSPDDLLTIRQPFLASEQGSGAGRGAWAFVVAVGRNRHQPNRARYRSGNGWEADLRRLGGRSGRTTGDVTTSFASSVITGANVYRTSPFSCRVRSGGPRQCHGIVMSQY